MKDRMSNGQFPMDQAFSVNKPWPESKPQENVATSLNLMKAQVTSFVAQKPGTAIVVGFLAGAALGWLVTRKK